MADSGRPAHGMLGCPAAGRTTRNRRERDGSGQRQRDGQQEAKWARGDAAQRGSAAAASLPLAAAGCSKGIGALGTPPPPLPDVAIVRNAIEQDCCMISRYNAVLTAVPALAQASLRPLLQQRQEHLARLRGRLIEPRLGRPPEHTPPATAAPAGPRRPGTPAAARDYLRLAEQAAASALLGKITAAPPSLAQLLASIAASEATHALLLAPGRRPG